MEFRCIPEFQILSPEHFGSLKEKTLLRRTEKRKVDYKSTKACLNVAKQHTHTPIAPWKTRKCCCFFFSRLETKTKFGRKKWGNEKFFHTFCCVKTLNLHNFPVICFPNCKHSIIVDTGYRIHHNLNTICRFYCYEVLLCFDSVLVFFFLKNSCLELEFGAQLVDVVRCT